MLQEATIRKIQRMSQGDHAPTLGDFGENLVSQLLPKYAKLNEMGVLYTIDMSGGTAIAPVTATLHRNCACYWLSAEAIGQQLEMEGFA